MTPSGSWTADAEDTRPGGAPRRLWGFTAPEWAELGTLYGCIAMLHIFGWGLFLWYSGTQPALVGLGLVAYLLGLRHGFDVDHIAAVDDTVRLMLQSGKRPLGVGFFFSLGHSTVVLLLVIGVVFAAALVHRDLPGWQAVGGIVGTAVSGTFLCAIGVMNLLILLDLLEVSRGARSASSHAHTHAPQLLARRGVISRLLGRRLGRMIRHSWQMYPLGLLFGLGFDTASEVGLLAMTLGASADHLPPAAVLSLPILFAAGMTVMDTTDGILMTKAYAWAFADPGRRLFYNLTITGISVAAALAVGGFELLQLAIRLLPVHGSWRDFVAGLDFSALGLLMAALFGITWIVSMTLWRLARRGAT